MENVETADDLKRTLQKVDALEGRYQALEHDVKALHTEIEEGAANAELDDLILRLRNSVPIELEKFYRHEVQRLSRLPNFSHDYQRISGHLEFLSELPWNKLAEGQFNREFAQKELEQNYYGLSEVKEQITEFMAISALKPIKKRAPVLIFLGPAGIGKVSLALSVAKCLGRPVERINFASARGRHFLLGEGRHQANASPGCIMRALHRCNVRNPVLVLEELDHVDWGRGDYSGIPLLEILDSRNSDFVDEYVGVPFDISQVWFILTVSSLDRMPRSLRSHVEVIEFSGYTDQEKIQIAEHFLIPRAFEDIGLTDFKLNFESSALLKIIRRYTRESGVMQLKQCIHKIIRKAVNKSQSSADFNASVHAESIDAYLGPEWFFEEESRNPMQPGVATGLVWAESGGEVIYIEAVRLAKGRGLILTGRLGKVMRESAETALSYLWSRAKELNMALEDFSQIGTHIHVPAGSIAKDGPSAGLTIFIALASLFLDQAIPHDVAMTGEITLTGDVFPVGGIREKVLAAHRAGFQRLIIPKQNETDLQVLPEEIRSSLQFILVKNVREVLPLVFPSLNQKMPAKKTRVGAFKSKDATLL